MNQVAIRQENKPKLMLLDYMADKYALTPDQFRATVRATCGLSTATPEQVAAFLIVAKEYDLNPLLKEIYAFPGKGGGVVPIVSIDGWVNLVNSHPQCDGFDFAVENDDNGLSAITCTMHRKDRSHPTVVTEYLSECVRPTEPWKMKHRMLRHKSFIQAARYAFGFAGIYDEDEGRVIADATDAAPRPRVPSPPEVIEHQPEPPTVEPEKPGSEISGDPVDDLPGEDENLSKPLILPLVPYCIVGKEYTAKTWADTYIAALQTSADTAMAFKWVDVNAAQLGKLSRAEFNRVKKATDEIMEKLRADPISSGVAKDKNVPDFDKNYDGWMTHQLGLIAKAGNVDDLEEIFSAIDGVWENLMPPDKTALSEAKSVAEDRLAP